MLQQALARQISVPRKNCIADGTVFFCHVACGISLVAGLLPVSDVLIVKLRAKFQQDRRAASGKKDHMETLMRFLPAGAGFEMIFRPGTGNARKPVIGQHHLFLPLRCGVGDGLTQRFFFHPASCLEQFSELVGAVQSG